MSIEVIALFTVCAIFSTTPTIKSGLSGKISLILRVLVAVILIAVVLCASVAHI